MTHLDTDIVVAYLNGNRSVADRLRSLIPDVAISVLVLAELLFGANISARADENKSKINRLLALTPPIPFDHACAVAYADLKVELRRIGRPTGEVDALIAATAIANGATLVTHNRRHFENIPHLVLDDWLG